MATARGRWSACGAPPSGSESTTTSAAIETKSIRRTRTLRGHFADDSLEIVIGQRSKDLAPDRDLPVRSNDADEECRRGRNPQPLAFLDVASNRLARRIRIACAKR